MEYIGKISAIVDDSSTSNVILLGDFNADVDTLFETELMEMCDSLNLLISDYSIFGRSSGQYTRVSNAHNTTSWLDHIICSHDVQKKLVCIYILDRLSCSDHLPLCVSFDFNCDPIVTSSHIIETHETQTNVTFSWAKATIIDIERCRTLTFELLKNINLLPAITCDDCNCKSAKHKLQIDQFYMQLCAVLEKASRECIPSFTVDSFRDYIIPGFTEHVKELHTIARADYCAWRADGKPRSGPLCFVMKQSRLRFESALRYCKVNEDAMRSNAFSKSLMDKDMNSFWRGIRKVNNAKIPLAYLPLNLC